jgi:hypothetical protein
MEIKGGGEYGGPMNIIYKGAIKYYNKRIHQIWYHITFMNMYDWKPIDFCIFGGK